MSAFADLATAGLDPLVAAGLMATSFVASFITVALGIGGGILLLAAMASFMPPLALIPVHGVIQLGSNATRALVLIRRAHWAPFGMFLAGSLAGAALGGVVLIDMPPAAIQIGVGLFVIWSIFATPPRLLTHYPALTGGVSSFLTMFFGATGPFVATFVKSLKLPRQEHVATHAVFMTLQHGLKLVVFGILGFAFGPWLGFMSLMILSGLCGTLLGRVLLERMTDHGFRRALNIILFLLALRLIWNGLSDLLP